MTKDLIDKNKILRKITWNYLIRNLLDLVALSFNKIKRSIRMPCIFAVLSFFLEQLSHRHCLYHKNKNFSDNPSNSLPFLRRF